MGKKRALVVGIERYANPRNNLPGVSNDVSAFVSILGKFGITDIEVIRDANATSVSIKTALDRLVSNAAADDVCIFYFSGHGALLPKEFAQSDDEDGRDEALVPFEGTTESLILDNWIGLFLKEKVPQGAFFYSIVDCCFSGQMYKRNTIEGFSNNIYAYDDELPTIKEIDFTSLIFTSNVTYMGSQKQPYYGIKQFVLEEDLVNSVHIAASEPDQTALVLSIDGQRRSAFTWALEQVLEPGITVENLERLVTLKQAERTLHHKPFVTSAAVNASRKVFS